MIFTLGSDEGWGLLGAAPGEQGNLIDTPASNRAASLSSDFHVGSHPRFHSRQKKKTTTTEMKKVMMEKPHWMNPSFSFTEVKTQAK